MSTTTCVVFQPPTNPYAVVMAPERRRRSPVRLFVLSVVFAALVAGGFAFNQWLTRASTTAATPTACVDGEATTAADYRSRTEAIARVGDDTQVAGVAICR